MSVRNEIGRLLQEHMDEILIDVKETVREFFQNQFLPKVNNKLEPEVELKLAQVKANQVIPTDNPYNAQTWGKILFWGEIKQGEENLVIPVESPNMQVLLNIFGIPRYPILMLHLNTKAHIFSTLHTHNNKRYLTINRFLPTQIDRSLAEANVFWSIDGKRIKYFSNAFRFATFNEGATKENPYPLQPSIVAIEEIVSATKILATIAKEGDFTCELLKTIVSDIAVKLNQVNPSAARFSFRYTEIPEMIYPQLTTATVKTKPTVDFKVDVRVETPTHIASVPLKIAICWFSEHTTKVEFSVGGNVIWEMRLKMKITPEGTTPIYKKTSLSDIGVEKIWEALKEAGEELAKRQ